MKQYLKFESPWDSVYYGVIVDQQGDELLVQWYHMLDVTTKRTLFYNLRNECHRYRIVSELETTMRIIGREERNSDILLVRKMNHEVTTS